MVDATNAVNNAEIECFEYQVGIDDVDRRVYDSYEASYCTTAPWESKRHVTRCNVDVDSVRSEYRVRVRSTVLVIQ